MARPLRIEFPGAIYHITSRGNDKKHIFYSDNDHESFLTVLTSVIEKYNWSCHAYCLMGNHYHLLIETHDANLSQGMRQLNGVYTQKYNKKRRHVGHLFQGRFKAFVISADEYFLEVARYVVLNPVRAGMVNNPEEYRWSNYSETMSTAPPPSFLTINKTLYYFTGHKNPQNKYEEFVKAGMNSASPFDQLRGGIVLGSAEFYDKVCDLRSDAINEVEIVKSERLANRPKLDLILTSSIIFNKKLRNDAIYIAHTEAGYTQKEIADYLGLHNASISRIVCSIDKMLKYKT